MISLDANHCHCVFLIAHVTSVMRSLPGGRGQSPTAVSVSVSGRSCYWCSVSPGVSLNTLSAVRSGALIWIAEAAIHRSLAWL